MFEDRNNICGWCTVGGKTFYHKSLIEKRWACVLEICKKNQDFARQILGHTVFDWQYEPKRFYYSGDDIPKHLEGKKHGVTVYTPDFRIFETEKDLLGNRLVVWHETKGYLDKKDTTKIKCFKLYYPDERLLVVMDGVPKGKTKGSRNKLARLSFLKDLDYGIINARPIFKSLGNWLNRMCMSGKIVDSKETKL